MASRIKEFINTHIYFGVNITSILSFLTAIIAIPMIIFMDPYSKIGYENGLLENIQMLFLFAGCWFAARCKHDKKFFYFVLMVLLIIILREVNCGRTLFFPVPGYENAFYSWKDIKYGYLAHPIFGAYIAFVGLYFLKNKLYVNLWNYIKGTRLPIWNILLMIIGAASGMYAEKAVSNYVFEEMAELLFYVSLFGIIWQYTVKNYLADKDNEN